VAKHVDVLVVGAGPAGLAAGIVFARNGFQTIVCEKKHLPIDKACGEGILPPGIAHLASLGVSKYIYPENYCQFVGIQYHSPGGYEARAEFQTGPGWGISRLSLSSAFQSRVKELDGLEVIEGIQVRGLDRHTGRIWVNSGGEVFSARLLVGADGVNSTVRRCAGLEGRAPSVRRWGVRQHFAIPPWSNYVEVHWRRGVEAYITPCGTNCVGIAFLIDRSCFADFSAGKQLIPSLIDFFPVIKRNLKGVKAIDDPLSTGPMQRMAKTTIADGVILIGDSAGYIDAITGDGINLALAQALALEQSVIPVLREKGHAGNTILSLDLLGYARAHKSLVAPHNRKTKLVLLLVHFPKLVDPVTAALGKNPKLFQRLIS
jgi:menaquinone-9 beta-reductase